MNSEVVRYRMLMLIAIIGFPAWGLLLSKLDPDLWDPIWIRSAFSILLTICFVASYKVSSAQKLLEHATIFGGWAMMIHLSWIAYVSHLPYPIFCGYLILLGGLLNVFPGKSSTWALAAFTILSGVVVALHDHQWIVSPILVNFAVWTTVATSLSANFTRIQQLQTLHQMQERMTVLFQNMKEGLLVFSSNEEVVRANPAACHLFGFELDDLKKRFQTDISFLHENGRPLQKTELPFHLACHHKQEVRDLILGIRRSDGGTIWAKMTATPFQETSNLDQNFVLVTLSDITDLKKSHQIIFQQQARLEATAKLTALGEMAGGVAHEINNPLAIILGKVHTIEKTLHSNQSLEPVATSLTKIAQTVERIKRIVKGLQTFASGGEQDPFELVSLKDLVNEAVSLCQEKLREKKIQIRLDLEPDLHFECRPIQISQCLINLIYNACDAVEPLSDRWIRIWTRSAHQSLVLTVTDSGSGIPEEVRSRLMQPFFTTKEPGKGTGLGLSITRGLINSHLGRIWLDSSAPHTTFIIELPLSQKSAKNAA